MQLQNKLLSFANLHEVALLLDPINLYEKQDQLVAYCRSEKKPFLRCDVCGIEMGEALLCFEDPLQALQEDPPPASGTPAGFICPINLSQLHGILAHDMLEDLEEILSHVQT